MHTPPLPTATVSVPPKRPRRRERNTAAVRDPAIRNQLLATARKNGWRVLAARRGMERFERRDGRSETGAVDIAVEFNHRGELVSAWRSIGDQLVDAEINGVETVMWWLQERV